MARQIVLDASVLGAWPLRGLLLGLGDRQPAIISPRWSPGGLERMRRELAAALSGRLGAAGARRQADALVDGMRACYPDATAEGDPSGLDLLDRGDAEVVAAAIAAGSLVVATMDPGRLPPADIGRLGIAARHPDDLLLELHANDPWKVLHSTVAFADVLRTPATTAGDVLDLLARWVPRFAAAAREQLDGLPVNQPGAMFAATPGQVPLAAESAGPWWCIACDPAPCAHEDGARVDLFGVHATVLSDECAFVAVTDTADHFTLVWPSPDDDRMRERRAQLDARHLHARVVPYHAGHGPAIPYYRWVETLR